MYNNVYQGKTVLVTGHTGFKGSWLAIWLTELGANVVGYSLAPYSNRGNFEASSLGTKIYADIRGNICNYDELNNAVKKYKPEIIFHLAAQALVKESYKNPRLTYETNLMGSFNILEVVRHNDCVKTVVMITSDKCYENVEQIWGYQEDDRMGGYDPYSSSKGCAELMIASMRNSFFNPQNYAVHGKAIASVRAGNVIGGGDWSVDRLIPDCIRAIEDGKDILIRSPNATRPWEHVLEPLSGYLRVGQKLMEDPVKYATSFNFGPPISANKTVLDVVNLVVANYGKGKIIVDANQKQQHENTLLFLDATKAYTQLNWVAKWNLIEMVQKTVDWYKASLMQSDMYDFCVQQINEHGDGVVN